MSEQKRLLEHKQLKANWKKWGPYLSERSWGTVREDYGKRDPWTSCSFEDAHKRVFRWGEDGLGGICDRFQYICFAFAFWNGKDPILKERLFGLNNLEGNHGEDVKEVYYYLDALPTSSYLKMLYRYPQKEFPYQQLREENKGRGLLDPEFEIEETGIFKEGAYFDVFIEYAKESEEDIFCRLTIVNNGDQEAPITVLPTLWFRNTWKWGYVNGPTGDDGGKPRLFQEEDHLKIEHLVLGEHFFYIDQSHAFLFCENEDGEKDAFHRYIIHGETGAVNAGQEGTKGAAVLKLSLGGKQSQSILCRLSNKAQSKPFKDADSVFSKRIKETDEFYDLLQEEKVAEDLKNIQRQAFAGLLFSKQFYYLNQTQWQNGDPLLPPTHSEMRNTSWDHLTTYDILSVPDKWEFPYFCCWDSSFHLLPMVMIDPDFAKRQLTLFAREWYMHPNGQFPAHEWCFSDTNPPVQAWALWRTYKIDAKIYGQDDRPFLESNFHKLLINFTWWVNKKDAEGNNVFQGGFLGMDNISVFDRNRDLPTGGHIDQSDGTAWMGFYCIYLMKIALHLAQEESIYQDLATKFFEHFLRIASAMTHHGGNDISLWDEKDGFFYDLLHLPNNQIIPLKVRSLVGLLPLLAVETLEPDLIEKNPVFKRRMDWFISKRPDISFNLACLYEGGINDRRLMSIVKKEQLIRILNYLFDEEEFLSPYGIRSLSKYHEKHPYLLQINGSSYQAKYIPGESNNRIFGGNSNWRGPIWFPINYLLIEALQRFYHYYGDDLKVEFPTRSGNFLNLWDAAAEISKRLISLFQIEKKENTPYVLFHEYYNPETGKGLGASHQTGWTALVAKLIQQSGRRAK